MQGRSPIQPNCNDCGMYTVLNAERVCNHLIQRKACPPPVTAGYGPPYIYLGALGGLASAFTLGDAKAYRALAFACLARIWLHALQPPQSDARWEIQKTSADALPAHLRSEDLWYVSSVVVHWRQVVHSLPVVSMLHSSSCVVCRDILSRKTLQEVKGMHSEVLAWAKGLSIKRSARIGQGPN